MPERKPNPTDARTYYQLGNDYYEKADYDRAIQNYNMAILLNPVFSEAFFNRALSYYQLKNFDKSVADYTKSMELDPQNPIIYNNRGDAYYRKQDFQNAIKDYDRAIAFNPNYLKAFYNRGLSYASTEEYEKAIEDFTKVIELKADFAEAYHLRGLAFEYAGSLTSAISDYEKALTLNPQLTEAKTHLESAKAKKEQDGKSGGAGGEGGTADVKMLTKPNMSFDDVAGMTKMKEEIRRSIVYPMRDPELARKYGKLGGGGILMYGPPGCGKCLSPDTPVILSDGQIQTIEHIYSTNSKKEKQINQTEFILEKPEISVPSLNPDNIKIISKKVDYLFKQRYKGKMYKITTNSGRTIEVTPEHPFITIDEGVKKVKAGNLTKGSYVAVPREIKIDCKTPHIQKLNGFNKLENGKLQSISFRHPNTLAINPLEIDDETAEYFGFLLSEGSSIYGTMYFSNSDNNLIQKVANTSSRFGVTPRIKPDTSPGFQRVEIGSVSLMKFLDQAYGFKLQGSRNTKVPQAIFQTTDRIVGHFLSAVFESEANVKTDVPEIEFTSASKEFANGLAYLLLRFGIVARIKSKIIKGNDHVYWRLFISGHETLQTFEQKIGFISTRKIGLLKVWTRREIRGNTNVDIIPNIKTLLRVNRENKGINKSVFYDSKNGNRYETGTRSLSRDYLKRIVDSHEVSELRKYSESDVLWDEVTDIECKDFDGYVYDLTVSDNHTFVAGFGGIVVHNTFIVKAAAGECKAGFINAKLSDLLDMYVGNTEKNIHKVFELARKNTPCILFFDEVDAIGGRRDQQEGQQYMRMAVNQMLYEIDGVEANNANMLIIAATNAPWDVDPALRRSGRFSKTIYLPEPDYDSRVSILKMHAKKRPCSPLIPFKLLAYATASYASADHKAIVDEAATLPWMEAFMSIRKKTEDLTKKGMPADQAEELAKKQVAQRSLTLGDFVVSIAKKRSSLPPWYEQAKKQIGKQEEVTIIDGKEHKKVTESKMGPGEKEAFKDLLGTINQRNTWYYKMYANAMKNLILGGLRVIVFVTEKGRIV